jgi:hypothetical protein
MKINRRTLLVPLDQIELYTVFKDGNHLSPEALSSNSSLVETGIKLIVSRLFSFGETIL